MASNSRLAIAVHTAGIIALGRCEPVSSELIARSAGTNPVVVRRIVGSLVKGGLVKVRKGTGGGAYLLRPAEKISLADIYLALEEDELFQVPELGSDHECPVGKAVRPVLEELFRGAEEAMVRHLADLNLQDVISIVLNKLPADCRPENDG